MFILSRGVALFSKYAINNCRAIMKIYLGAWYCFSLSLWIGWISDVEGVMKTSINDVDLNDLNVSSSDISELKSKLQYEWNPGLIRDPIELAGLPEGDILPNNLALRQQKEGGAQDKTAVAEFFRLWPGGIVPYQFSAIFIFLPLERYMIRQVMADIQRHSCVRFVERKSQKDYVKMIYDRNRCYSHIGRVGGVQKLSLGFFCIRWWDRGTIYHELFHSLGFFHEHNRPDRDRHVKIHWSNIKWGNRKNFEKRRLSAVEMFDMPYDIRSVMHYSPYAFAKWHYFSPTIESRSVGYDFRRANKPSRIDYQKLNRLYRCHRQGPFMVSQLGDTGPSSLWFEQNGFELSSPVIQPAPGESDAELHPALLRIQTGLDEKTPALVDSLPAPVKRKRPRIATTKTPKTLSSASILRNWPRPQNTPAVKAASPNPVSILSRIPKRISHRPSSRSRQRARNKSIGPATTLQPTSQNMTAKSIGHKNQRRPTKGRLLAQSRRVGNRNRSRQRPVGQKRQPSK